MSIKLTFLEYFSVIIVLIWLSANYYVNCMKACALRKYYCTFDICQNLFLPDTF